MKPLYYILLCALPLLVAACDREEYIDGGYNITGFTPWDLEFGLEGGSAEITANGDLCYIALNSIDGKSAVEIFGEYRIIDLKFNRNDQFPVTRDLGVCTVTVTSPRNVTVTVPPNSEYREIKFSANAYDGRADSFMVASGFSIWRVGDGE